MVAVGWWWGVFQRNKQNHIPIYEGRFLPFGALPDERGASFLRLNGIFRT